MGVVQAGTRGCSYKTRDARDSWPPPDPGSSTEHALPSEAPEGTNPGDTQVRTPGLLSHDGFLWLQATERVEERKPSQEGTPAPVFYRFGDRPKVKAPILTHAASKRQESGFKPTP